MSTRLSSGTPDGDRRSGRRRAGGSAHRDGFVRSVVSVLLLLTIVAGACNELPAEPITFENQSDQTIVIVRSASESVYTEILAGRTLTDSGCVDPDLEARLEDGAVVASRPGPFCEGDPAWVITQAAVDAAG